MSTVLLRRDGGIAHLTLNRPDAGNAIDPTLAADLARAATDVAADPAVRASCSPAPAGCSARAAMSAAWRRRARMRRASCATWPIRCTARS